jgi:hypothetical protein
MEVRKRWYAVLSSGATPVSNARELARCTPSFNTQRPALLGMLDGRGAAISLLKQTPPSARKQRSYLNLSASLASDRIFKPGQILCDHLRQQHESL